MIIEGNNLGKIILVLYDHLVLINLECVISLRD